MKNTICFLLCILLLPSCVSVTETRPDGTVIVTKGIDRESVKDTASVVTTVGTAYLESKAKTLSGK